MSSPLYVRVFHVGKQMTLNIKVGACSKLKTNSYKPISLLYVLIMELEVMMTGIICQHLKYNHLLFRPGSSAAGILILFFKDWHDALAEGLDILWWP